ncbi:MAG: DUF2157 domain-containing protein [Chthoniobacterales bacterium]
MNKNHLKKETDKWLSQQIIDDGQQKRILALYPDSGRNYWMLAFGVIGVVLCLGGISLIVASNWKEIPALLKFICALLLLIGSTVFAIESRRRKMPAGYSEACWLIASALPLLCLALISQIFHLEGKTSDLFLIWVILISPLPFLSGSVTSLVALLISITALIGVEMADWNSLSFSQGCLIFIAWGVICFLAAQLCRCGHAVSQWIIAEFWGLVTALLTIYVWGFATFFRSGYDLWISKWFGIFLICLGLIFRGYRYARPHQVNLGFVFIALVIVSTFIRLVGSMMHTGLIFIIGGLGLLILVFCLERLRRGVLGRMSH